MIDREHRLSFTRQAHLPSMSLDLVYHLTQHAGPADLAMMRRIDEVHQEQLFMGAHGLRPQLRCEGVAVGRRQLTALV